jgi:hypothetical protein
MRVDIRRLRLFISEIKSACSLVLMVKVDLPTVPSIRAKRMSQVVLMFPFLVAESKETTLTIATIMVIIPTVKTIPTENFCVVDICRLYKICTGIAMTVAFKTRLVILLIVVVGNSKSLLIKSVSRSTAKAYQRLAAFATLSR